jgi:2'-5' RNA ligase
MTDRGPAPASSRDGDADAPPAGAERPWRLFVALTLPEEVRAALAGYGAAADAAAWRPVAPDALHLTLAFLGSRPPGDADAVAAVLAAEAGSPAPRLKLAGALLLPPRRARVLTVALDDPDGTLAALQGRVATALERIGVYTPEARPFRAHVTVARVRPRVRPPRAAEPAPEAAFTATALTLYRSLLHPKGARYEPLSSAMLAA